MKKVLALILVIILIIAMIVANVITKHHANALKFKKEYEELNGGTLTEVTIPEDNPIKYINIAEATQILKNGTGIIYIGYPECNACRKAIPTILEVAKELKVQTIYYLNINEYNNKYKVENGKTIKIKIETEGYYEFLEEAKEITREYVIYENDIPHSINETRVYSPTLLKVENGEIIDYKTGVSVLENDDEITKKETLKQQYLQIMK